MGKQYSGIPDWQIDPNDRTYLCKTVPDFFYGLNIGADFKGFDLAFFGSLGRRRGISASKEHSDRVFAAQVNVDKYDSLYQPRINIAASNLFTITKYTCFDPEVSTQFKNESQLEAGRDAANIP